MSDHSSKNNELAELCIAAVKRKLTTTFESIGQPGVDIELVRSTVKPCLVPASIKIVLEPNTHRSVAPGACIPPGAHQVGTAGEAGALVQDRLIASPDDYRAAHEHLRSTFAGEGLAVGSGNTHLPAECSNFIVAYTCPCPGCGGQRSVKCPSCGGLGALRCSNCQGEGYITKTHTEPGQVPGSSTAHIGASNPNLSSPGPDIVSTQRFACPRCLSSGRVACSNCRGNGAVVCNECRGIGCVTNSYSVTYEIKTTFEWASNEIQDELKAWVRCQDLEEIVRDHADIELQIGEDPPESHHFLRYNVTIPFGTVSFRFAENGEDQEFVVAGKAGDIVRQTPFLEPTLPPFRKLRGDALAISYDKALAVLTDAVEHPVVKLVSTKALVRADADHDEVANEVRRTLPAGLTHERICEVVDAARCYAHLAFDRRRVFVSVARYALLSLIVFGAYFVFPLRVWLELYTHSIVAHLVDLGAAVAAVVGVSVVASRVTASEVQRTFSPLLDVRAGQPRAWNKLNNHFAPSAKVRAFIYGEVLLLFMLSAIIATWMGRNPPVWILWIFSR